MADPENMYGGPGGEQFLPWGPGVDQPLPKIMRIGCFSDWMLIDIPYTGLSLPCVSVQTLDSRPSTKLFMAKQSGHGTVCGIDEP